MNYNQLHPAKFTWTALSIALLAVMLIIGAHFIVLSSQNLVLEPPIENPIFDVPSAGANIPTYSIEFTKGTEISWEHHPVTDTIHLIIDENDKLIGIKFIDITENYMNDGVAK